MKTPFDCLTESGDVIKCTTDAVMSSGPSPGLIGLLIGGTLLTSLYIAGNRDPVVPAIVTILFGGALVPMLPAQYVDSAYAVVILGVTAAGVAAWQRYVVTGGVRR